VKLAPIKARLERTENQTSVWLSQDAWVGGEVKTDVFVVRQPPIIFGLVGVEIVQNDVNFAARLVGGDAVHEIQELDAPTALVIPALTSPVVTSSAANRVVVPWRL
jgi:hypothetical protein